MQIHWQSRLSLGTHTGLTVVTRVSHSTSRTVRKVVMLTQASRVASWHLKGWAVYDDHMTYTWPAYQGELYVI